MEMLFETSSFWAITVVRVTLGVIFFAHGAQKVFGWFGGYGLKGTTRYFTSIGLPLVVAYAVCFFELLGGIGLLLGLLTRLAALAVIVVMVGAIAKAHWVHGVLPELGAHSRQGSRLRGQPGLHRHGRGLPTGGGRRALPRRRPRALVLLVPEHGHQGPFPGGVAEDVISLGSSPARGRPRPTCGAPRAPRP